MKKSQRLWKKGPFCDNKSPAEIIYHRASSLKTSMQGPGRHYPWHIIQANVEKNLTFLFLLYQAHKRPRVTFFELRRARYASQRVPTITWRSEFVRARVAWVRIVRRASGRLARHVGYKITHQDRDRMLREEEKKLCCHLDFREVLLILKI